MRENASMNGLAMNTATLPAAGFTMRVTIEIQPKVNAIGSSESIGITYGYTLSPFSLLLLRGVKNNMGK